mgnify:CR=1 FL=1
MEIYELNRIRQMSNKKFLPLPYGKNGYEEIRNGGCYYVDKTPYIKTLIDTDKSAVMLFTRPRRFGKTVFMSTLNSFLKINKENPTDTSEQLRLFEGTQILKDTEFCEKYMGKYPVIFITLKSVDGDNFEDAYKMFADTVWKVSSEYEYLLESSKLNQKDKEILSQLTDINYLEDSKNSSRLKNSLRYLSELLYKEYGKLPVLLIDEYDVPLAKASYHDLLKYKTYDGKIDANNTYHARMVTLMSGFLGVLKDENTLTKTVMTGCLKVAKNSIFTGVNNLYVNTVTATEKDYTGLIGFTKDETNRFLDDYDLSEYSALVKDNYDGYRFYDKEMFCPWDVVNFIRNNYKLKIDGELQQIHADNYWTGTTSSSSIYEYLGYLTDKDTQKMQDLIDGKSISFSLNDSMNYDSLSEHNPDDFWSLLLHTGYLTLDWDKTTEELSKANSSSKNIFVRIPNLEIRECFIQNIQQKFKEQLSKDNTASSLVNSFLDGKAQEASDILFDLLQHYVSVRDTATKAPHENYYHGFLNGLFSNCKDIISDYHSNYESGDGYADITFKSKREDKLVIIEIKSASVGSDLITLSEEAVAQIEKKNYASPFMQDRMTKCIYAYGIAFSGKNCAVKLLKLK